MLAHATTYNWTNTSVGEFSDPSNWQPTGVPGAADDVILENNYTSGQHTVVINGQSTASTTAEASGQTTVLQLNGGYTTGAFDLFSGGGLVELTGVGTMTATSLGNLDLSLMGCSLTINGAASPNSCTVNGAGAFFQSEALQIGDFFDVTNEATATCASVGNTGILSVTGVGSSLTVAGLLAPYTINILDGAIVSANAYLGTTLLISNEAQLTLGGDFTPSGGFLPQTTLCAGGKLFCGNVVLSNSLPTTITDTNTVWSVGDVLTVAQYASISVLNGGQITAAYGGFDGSEILVQGANSQLNVSMGLTVGNFYDTSVEVSQGGTVSASALTMGEESGTYSQALVHDSGSSLTLQTATIGAYGNGTVLVTNNAIMASDAVQVGPTPGTGTLEATTGAVITVHSNVYVGKGSAVLLSGATLNLLGNDAVLGIGQGGGSADALMQAAGAGTQVNNINGSVRVGENNSGTLQISGGASVTAQSVYVGGTSLPYFAPGFLTVSNTGSSLQVLEILGIGGILTEGETGQLAVTNGGFVQVGRMLSIFATGDLRIFGGSVNVGAATNPPANTLFVNTGGWLASAGGIAGNVVAGPGGSVSIGFFDGTANIAGNYTQEAGAQLSLNIDGTNASSGYDLLSITGNVSLAGTLTLNFTNGFAPTAGQVYNLINYTGSLSGNFSTVVINGLAPGFQYSLQPQNGALQLVALNTAVAVSSPALSVTPIGNQLNVSWFTNASGYTLQATASLNPTNWVNVATSGNQYSVPTTNPAEFFRLYKSAP